MFLYKTKFKAKVFSNQNVFLQLIQYNHIFICFLNMLPIILFEYLYYCLYIYIYI